MGLNIPTNKVVDGVEYDICKECDGYKPISEFYTYTRKITPDKVCYSSLCKYHHCLITKIQRRDPNKVYLEVFRKLIAQDRIKGLKNDLTKKFVKDKLAQGKCDYCEESNLRLTLDRINNDIGHFQSNCNVACIRCNLWKQDMPQVAWEKIVPHFKYARLENKFGNWTGPIKSVVGQELPLDHNAHLIIKFNDPKLAST